VCQRRTKASAVVVAEAASELVDFPEAPHVFRLAAIGGIGEVDSPLAIEAEIVRSIEALALIRFGPLLAVPHGIVEAL